MQHTIFKNIVIIGNKLLLEQEKTKLQILSVPNTLIDDILKQNTCYGTIK